MTSKFTFTFADVYDWIVAGREWAGMTGSEAAGNAASEWADEKYSEFCRYGPSQDFEDWMRTTHLQDINGIAAWAADAALAQADRDGRYWPSQDLVREKFEQVFADRVNVVDSFCRRVVELAPEIDVQYAFKYERDALDNCDSMHAVYRAIGKSLLVTRTHWHVLRVRQELEELEEFGDIQDRPQVA